MIHEERSLSEIFIKYLLLRARQTESDLLDQLFNSSEKRLARILLLMAEFGEPDQFEGLIPEITEDELAQMIGAPRSRVSFFMNHFHELGLIDYDGRIRVHRALLNAILHDQLPGNNGPKAANHRHSTEAIRGGQTNTPGFRIHNMKYTRLSPMVWASSLHKQKEGDR